MVLPKMSVSVQFSVLLALSLLSLGLSSRSLLTSERGTAEDSSQSQPTNDPTGQPKPSKDPVSELEDPADNTTTGTDVTDSSQSTPSTEPPKLPTPDGFFDSRMAKNLLIFVSVYCTKSAVKPAI